MAESFFAFILVAIFISLLLSIKGQRHTEELNEVIKGIEDQGKEVENFIRAEYKINTIQEAIEELEKMKSSFVKFIYKITESIK